MLRAQGLASDGLDLTPAFAGIRRDRGPVDCTALRLRFPPATGEEQRLLSGRPGASRGAGRSERSGVSHWDDTGRQGKRGTKGIQDSKKTRGLTGKREIKVHN